jgi:hypothetical protein
MGDVVFGGLRRCRRNRSPEILDRLGSSSVISQSCLHRVDRLVHELDGPEVALNDNIE